MVRKDGARVRCFTRGGHDWGRPCHLVEPELLAETKISGGQGPPSVFQNSRERWSDM